MHVVFTSVRATAVSTLEGIKIYKVIEQRHAEQQSSL